MSRYFYAVRFWSARDTTTGEPNPRTGCMNRAIDIEVFKTEAARDEWVDGGKVTSDMGENCRQPVTKKELRDLRLGWSLREFNDHLEMLQPTEDD